MHVAQNTQRGWQLNRELQEKTQRSSYNRHAALRGNAAPTEGKGPSSLPKPSPESTHPHRHAGSGMAQGGPLATTIPVGGATSTERGHSCLGRGVSRFALLLRTSIPSFGGLPGQSRRSLRFTHSTHTMTPLWWKILCPVWTLIAPRLGCRALVCTSSPLSETELATHRSGAHRPRIGSRPLLGQCRSATEQELAIQAANATASRNKLVSI